MEWLWERNKGGGWGGRHKKAPASRTFFYCEMVHNVENVSLLYSLEIPFPTFTCRAICSPFWSQAPVPVFSPFLVHPPCVPPVPCSPSLSPHMVGKACSAYPIWATTQSRWGELFIAIWSRHCTQTSACPRPTLHEKKRSSWLNILQEMYVSKQVLTF